MGEQKDPLMSLPVTETRESFWWREYLDEKGVVFHREHLFQLYLQKMRTIRTYFYMTAKCKLAFWLLKGVADPCPYCNKLIDIGPWKKLIDDQPTKEGGDEDGHEE